MSTILLSFEPEWFRLLESGKKKFEYRKHFPTGKETTIYFYVSRPVKAITGIALFGERETLQDWLEKNSSRSCDVKNRILDFMNDNRFAIPMLSFTKTNEIPLDKLRADILGFIVPRMYYYLDDTPLLKYLQSNLIPLGQPITHDFQNLRDEDIC